MVAIVGGKDKAGALQKTFELLKIRTSKNGEISFCAKEWELVESSLLTPCQFPLICQLSEESLYAFGGIDDRENVLASGVELNVKTKKEESFD